MTIVLPTPGQDDWDTPLNAALSSLQDDITAGASTYLTTATANSTYAKLNNTLLVNALQKGNNLSDVTDASIARTSLGLGTSAVRDVGTTNTTVASGDAVPTHAAATDPHGDRAWATSQFLPITGGLLSGALTIGTGGLTLTTGNLNITSGNITQTGNVSRTGNTSQTGTISGFGFSSTAEVFTASVGGDAVNRHMTRADGLNEWGDGTNPRDTNLYRASANVLATDDDLAFNTTGKSIKVKEGTNAKMGIATLVAGGATVATTAVTSTSRIFMTVQVPSGSVGAPRVASRVAGTSFTIASSQPTDTSTVAWLLIEPA